MSLRPALALLLLVLATACAGVPHDAAVAGRVARVERGRLAQHLQSLHEIGPRPKDDSEATEATLRFLTSTLASFGYEVRTETFEAPRAGVLVARVRPVGAPEAEVVERVLPAGLAGAGPQALAAASARLAEEGLEPLGFVLSGPPEGPPLRLVNVIAERRGVRLPARVVELGAHYDTVPLSPGADDNGSGVAAVLEVARVLADCAPARTIRFVFFAGEEHGLLGSRAHVDALVADGGSRVEGLLNLDAVGFTDGAHGSQRSPVWRIPWLTDLPHEGDFLLVFGNWSSGWIGNLFEEAAATYAPRLRLHSANRLGGWIDDARRGDHASYWSAGLDAASLTDTSEYRNATYHLPDDVPGTLDLAFLEQVTRATTATMLVWADR